MNRPTAVTVLGVLGIVFSALGLCCLLVGSAGLAVVFGMGEALTAQGGNQDPELQALSNPTFQRYMIVSLVIGLAFSLWLLIGAILLLRMLPIGRTLMLTYAAFAVLWSIVDTALTFTVLRDVVGARSLVQQSIGFIVGLIYPLAVLIVLTRPNIAQAFEQQAS